MLQSAIIITLLSDGRIYQVKVALKHTQPRLWRRFQVRGDELHRILQIVIGWTDLHLHQFVLGQKRFIGMPDEEFPDDCDILDERRVKLCGIITAPKKKLVYEYDFGDGWEHELLFEKILPPEPSQRDPVCLASAMACPLEDSGGLWGYYEKLAIVKQPDPDNIDHQEILNWMPEDFDPAAFDLEGINARLRRLR